MTFPGETILVSFSDPKIWDWPPHFMKKKKHQKNGKKTLSYKKIVWDKRLVTQIVKSIYPASKGFVLSFGLFVVLFVVVFHPFVLFVAAPLLFSLVCWVSLLHMGFAECECFIETQKRNKKVVGFTEGKILWRITLISSNEFLFLYIVQICICRI